MQMWCLLRVFPFLVLDKVEENNLCMDLIIYLLRIMEIVFAPKLTDSILPYFGVLITEFLNLFMKLFPHKDPINKMHNMVHYPECISQFGPLIKLWCMGYERKHGPMKRRAQVVCNFKNVPQTLLRISQSMQCAMWGNGDLKIYSVKCHGGKNTYVEHTHSARDIMRLGYAPTDVVFKTKLVYVNGAKYATGLFVCLEARQQCNINLPLFGKITEITVLKQSKVYLRTLVFETLQLDDRLNAYLIQKDEGTETVMFLPTTKLAYYRPFSAWRLPTTDEQYISARHILL